MSSPHVCGVHKLVADAVIISAGEVLLVKYRDTNKYDQQTGWFVPDDLLQYLEHPEQAAMRILKEQLGVTVPKLTLGFIESFKGNDGTWHLTFHYYIHFEKKPELTPSGDVKDMRWFPHHELPPIDDVAHHGWAVTIVNRLEEYIHLAP